MDKAIEYYFNKKILNKTKLTGGFSFDTWLIITEDGEKLVYRACCDYVNTGGRKISIVDIFKREKFFYETLNNSIGEIFPCVYVIDDTKAYCDKTFQIYKYAEGETLSRIKLDAAEKSAVDYKLGVLLGRIHNTQISPGHPYIAERGAWNLFIAQRLYERLYGLRNNGIIKPDEIQKLSEYAKTAVPEYGGLSCAPRMANN